MTTLEKNLIVGRLGPTRDTHKGSPTVRVERTMDNAASRTGIAPPHLDEDDAPGHESIMQHMTARLGLVPEQAESVEPAAECSEAAPPAEKPCLPRTLHPEIETPRRPVLAPAVEPAPAAENDDHHDLGVDEPRKRTRENLMKALHQLELAHHVEPTAQAEAAAEERHHHRHDRRRHKRRRRRPHHKTTFQLCSRTLKCLKAYARVTGRWQYNLVGEALESYLELAITALDADSLENMRKILQDLHAKN